jgi:Fe2+ or Zn2+ uptake regulation protein
MGGPRIDKDLVRQLINNSGNNIFTPDTITQQVLDLGKPCGRGSVYKIIKEMQADGKVVVGQKIGKRELYSIYSASGTL